MRRIETANEEALGRMLAADPVLVDVVPAIKAMPTLTENRILHAGPPINWDKMCGPMRGAVCGIAVFEGWAKKLVGLGHGLTPSGDDFLGGAMIALHAIGKGEICSLLWSKIGSYVAASTNSISLAHLRAASDGMGSDWIHRALSTIASGDVYAMDEPIAGIGRIGYSSGWDIVSGSIAVLDS